MVGLSQKVLVWWLSLSAHIPFRGNTIGDPASESFFLFSLGIS
jgi:hypothetical protein